MRCVIDLDKTVFSGGRASLLRPLPSFRNGAARTGRRDFLGLVGLYTGAKVRLFRRMGKKSALYSLRPPEKQLFRHLSLVFPSLFQAPYPIHIAVTHHIIEASTPSPRRESPQSSTRRRSGGGRRWSTCIKRWNVATLSPRRRTPAARPTSTQPEESAGRLPGWIKIPSRPGTCIRRGSRAPQAADHRRGERAKRGETTSSRSGYSPAGMAGCAPEAGGSSVAMGDCPLSAGKNSTPSVPRASGRCGANESM